MTSYQLPVNRERLEKIKSWRETYGAGSNVMLPAEEAEELACMALAAMDSEPVAWTWQYREQWHVTNDEERARNLAWNGVKVMPLYRHAQPAPVITFYRDGIEAAAKWIDQQREAYDSENGRHDPDTSSFEFGSEIKREYSSTLEELAEGIRALHPNAGNSPVIPDGYVMVPKEPTAEMIWAAKYVMSSTVGWASFKEAYIAMLAAAPHDNPALNSVQSVATMSGGWIPVSERMPDDDDFVYIWPRPDFGVDLHVGQYCECSPKGEGWYAQIYEQNYGVDWHPITVTHWMPLPAAPQEVPDEK